MKEKRQVQQEGGKNKMNIRKWVSVALVGSILMVLLAGCQTSDRSPVGKPPAPMKSVTQNSEEDYATFEFQLPEGWTSGPQSYLTVAGCPKEAVTRKFETMEDTLPFVVSISNYYHTGLKLSEEDKEMYQDLFSGKTKSFEERINRSYTLSDDLGTPSGAKDFFGLLLPEETNSSQTSSNANVPQKDFEYHYYSGTNGKITEVRYSYSYNGKTVRIVQCYREDIPYLITGAADDSVDLSSGEIALWVADSLKVTEHFTEKDNRIEKKN